MVLNTLVEVDAFKRPWSMEPFARRGIGELYLRTLSKPAFRVLMGLQGVTDRSAVTGAELDAYVDLLKRENGGRAFLQIMRGFERTPAKRDLYHSVLGSTRYPRAGRLGCAGPRAQARPARRGRPPRRRRHHDPPPPRQALPARGPSARHRRAGRRDHAPEPRLIHAQQESVAGSRVKAWAARCTASPMVRYGFQESASWVTVIPALIA